MGKAVICYNNIVDKGSLSGGSWVSTLPLNNLKNRIQSKVARSTNANIASTKFVETWAEEVSVSAVALANHNIQTDGQIQIRLYDKLDALVFDSGLMDVWPSVYNSTSLEWEDTNFWSRKYKLADLVDVRWNFIYLLSVRKLAYKLAIDIFDPTNTDGYVQIGRPHFASIAWEPRVNMSVGAALYYETNSTSERALSGTKYYDVKVQYRVARFSLDNMSQDESMTRAFDMQRLVGIDKELIFIWDRDDTVHKIRRSFVGTMRQLQPIEVPNYDRHRTSFDLEEDL